MESILGLLISLKIRAPSSAPFSLSIQHQICSSHQHSFLCTPVLSIHQASLPYAYGLHSPSAFLTITIKVFSLNRPFFPHTNSSQLLSAFLSRQVSMSLSFHTLSAFLLPSLSTMQTHNRTKYISITKHFTYSLFMSKMSTFVILSYPVSSILMPHMGEIRLDCGIVL